MWRSKKTADSELLFLDETNHETRFFGNWATISPVSNGEFLHKADQVLIFLIDNCTSMI